MLIDPGSQLSVVSGFLQGISAAEPAVSELNTLLAEMRLVVPNDIVFIAGQVSTVCFVAKSASAVSAFPLRQRLAAGAMVNASLNVFVNAVRHEVGLPYLVPREVELKDVGNVLKDLAAQQRNES